MTTPVRVDILADNGLRPRGTIRLTSETGKIVDASLSFEELLSLVAGMASDPRFKVGGRNPKPDKGLQAGVDDLFEKAKQ